MGASFVGRTDELAALHDLVRATTARRPHLLAIEGEPGIGKSRLVDESLRSAAHPLRVLRGRAEEMDRDRPFAALVNTLGLSTMAGEDDSARDLVRLLELDALPLEVTHGPTLRYHIIDELLEYVSAAAQRTPLLLVIEDLQWADPASLDTLRRLIRTDEGPQTVGLILTMRPSPRTPALGDLLETLHAAGGTTLNVGPLPDEAVRELVVGVVGAPPGPNLTIELGGARGNPLFVTELLAALAREGALEVRNGTAEATTPGVPPSLRLTILRRLRFLSPETLDTLRLAAVLGSSFSVEDVSLVTGAPATQLVPVLDDALAAQVITSAGAALAFRHELVRQAIYEDLPVAIRNALHSQVARALAAAGRAATDVAAHAVAGAAPGDHEAVTWLRRAAAEVAPRDPSTQAAFLERALELTHPGDEARAEMIADLLPALLWSGRMADGERLAHKVLERNLDPPLEVRIRQSIAQGLLFEARLTDAVGVLDRTSERAGALHGAHIRADSAYYRLFAGRRAEALEDATAALQLAEQTDDRVARWKALNLMCVDGYLSGRLDYAIDAGMKARASFPDAESLHGGERGLWPFMLALPLIDADRLDEAQRLLDAELDRQKALFQTTAYHFFMGISHFMGGRWEEAGSLLRAWLELAQEARLRWGAGSVYTILIRIAVHREDLADATRWRDRMRADLADQPREDFDVYFSMWGEAAVAEAHGDTDLALNLLAGATAIVSQLDALAHLRLIAPDYVRLLVAADRAAEAEPVAAQVDEVASRAPGVATARAAALRCRGLAAGDADLLGQAVAEYRRGPRPLELAATAEDAARLTRSSDEAAAIALAQEALTTYEMLGAARDSRRVEALLRGWGVRRGRRGRRERPVSGWDALTETELRVAELIATGLRNAEIAERLFVSKRTVDAHVRHIFAKLGIKARSEVAAEAARRASGGTSPAPKEPVPWESPRPT